MFSSLLRALAPRTIFPGINEIVPGTEKPSIILMKMLVAEMLQDLSNNAEVRRHSLDFITHKIECKSFKAEFRQFTNYEYYLPKDAEKSIWSVFQFEYLKGDFQPDKVELEILTEGFKQFRTLSARHAAIIAEEKRQQEAVSAIAAYMGIEEDYPDEEDEDYPDEYYSEKEEL